MKLVTVAQMRALEQAAIEAGSSEGQLMEEAGLAVAQETWMLLGSLENRRIAVLCGPGNNGGDGLVAARHLLDWGAEVITYLVRPPREPARIDEIKERSGAVVSAEEDDGYAGLETLVESADLVLDAVLGVGRQRDMEESDPVGSAMKLLKTAREGYSPPRLIAVDVPSGLDADSGAVDALTPSPDLTVTFGLPKVGMYQAPGSTAVGRIQVIDIGIPAETADSLALELMTTRWARETLPLRPDDANKGTFGKVLIVGGSRRYAGAPRLAAEAAYRAGAGLVTVACPESIQAIIAAGIAEATWLPQPETADGTFAGEAAISLRHEWRGFAAAVLGPGIADEEQSRALVWAVLPDLEDLGGGVVIDADALNAVASFPDGADRVPANAVLTPHPGEMARLLDVTTSEVQSSRLERAGEAARKYGCVVVLKGAHSVVADAQGRIALSPFANPLLATAGSGDVLAGVIAGYLAQGLLPFEAAALGTYVHGASGDALKETHGTAGLLAGEIAAHLPATVKEISTT